MKDIDGRTLMAMSVCSGSHDCFRRVLDALTSGLLSKDEVIERYAAIQDSVMILTLFALKTPGHEIF